jgi:ribose-phosphate pyrophosphokinase
MGTPGGAQAPQVLYALSVHRHLAETLGALTGLEQGQASIGRFSNGELHVELRAEPAGRDCIVLGAVAPPDEHLLSTLLLCHTLRKEGARKITALLPYLGYARHDRAEPRKSRAAAWLGDILVASGVSRVITVDVHSSLIHQLVPAPVVSVSAAPLFAAQIAKLPLTDPVVVAPDEGALERSEAVRRSPISRKFGRLTGYDTRSSMAAWAGRPSSSTTSSTPARRWCPRPRRSSARECGTWS